MRKPVIQLALDCSSTEEAIRDCQTGVVDAVDILECGYSLIAAEGARVVKLFREMYPNKPLLADLKIVDAGNKIGGMLLDGRPDYTTVLCACEPGTIIAVKEEAVKRNLNTKIQIELYGRWSMEDVRMWKELGVSQLTLQHSGDKPGGWTAEELETLKQLCDCGIDVAATGSIGYDDLELFKGIPVSCFIFGRAIRGASDPRAEAERIQKKIAELWAD